MSRFWFLFAAPRPSVAAYRLLFASGILAASLTFGPASRAFAQATPRALPQHVTPWAPVPKVRPSGRAQARAAQKADLNSITWTSLGPASLQGFGENFSGRITGIAADPTDSQVLYIAAAGGGLWKTTNGGATWEPLTDLQPTLSMGAVAVAPSNPSVIYAGTGEANNSGDSNYGLGILVSQDGGVSWTLATGPSGAFTRLTTSQIAIDPNNSSIAYAAMSGFGENTLNSGNAGVWKTTDAGASWTNTSSSAAQSLSWSAVVIDPNNSQIVYAAAGVSFGDFNNGVYKSSDGGNNWRFLSNFPAGAGRISVALSKSNSQVLYAAASWPSGSNFGILYKMLRSDDGGNTFTDLTPGTPNVSGRQGWYDLAVAVDPLASSTVYVAGSAGPNSMIRSTDSGASWTDISFGGPTPPHADHHAFAFDAIGRLLDGDDGGIYRLDDPAAVLWSDLNGNLSTIQFTGIGLHPTDPNIAVGGSQDNGTEIFDGLSWTETDGGDGGFAKINQQNPSVVYHQIPVESFGANFFRRSDDGGATWATKTNGIAIDLDHQNFYAPFVMDRSDGNHVLYGTNRVWETTDAGETWTAISNIGVAGFSNNPNLNVDAIALSPSDANTIYAVKNPSPPEIYVTTDHGATWVRNFISMANSGINDIQVDPTDSQTAYAVINRFTSGQGNVLRTTDGGANWTNISGNLPSEPVWSIQIDGSTNPHTLYVGADDGVYVTTDSGITWSRFGSGLPNAQAVQLELNPGLHLLGVATHGRGMWEIQTPAASAATITKVVSLTPDGIYGAGSRISIEVTFSEAVDVTGYPTLALNSGGIAAYSSGSGSNALTFVYTVEVGQSSPHLDYRSATALTLGGGTITGPGGEAAQLTLPVTGAPGSLGANSNLVIDAIAPEVVSYSVLFGAQRFDLTTSSRNHLPWRVTGIQVVFSKPIASGDDRSLAGIRTSGFNGLGTNTLTWSVGPLRDRDAATSLLAFGPDSLKDAAGNALHNGIDINRNFDVLYGDFDDDGVVGKSDVYGVGQVANGPYNIFADINGDGVVDATDVRIIRQRLGAE